MEDLILFSASSSSSCFEMTEVEVRRYRDREVRVSCCECMDLTDFKCAPQTQK